MRYSTWEMFAPWLYYAIIPPCTTFVTLHYALKDSPSRAKPPPPAQKTFSDLMKPEASSSDHPSKSWLKEQIELHMKREENCSHMSYDIRNSCNKKCEEGGKACDTYEKLKALHAENPGFWTEKLDHE